MWFVVTFGSPAALNIERLVSRIRSRVWRAMPRSRFERRSAAELLHEVDVFLHRLVALRALELRPRLVLGRADEIEEAGLRAGDVAFRSLLVERVELEQRVVVGTFGQFLDVFRGLLEARFEIGHGSPGGMVPAKAELTSAQTKVR